MAAIAVAPGVIAGCSCGDTGGTAPLAAGGAGPGSASGTGGGIDFPAGVGGGLGGGDSGACEGLECQQVQCEGGAKTTVSGTVYDPSGQLPLYNVIVYVPNAPLDPITDGATCDRCDATLSGAPLVTALTDTEGKFVLEDVPAGEDIPIVVQVGKWRREIRLPAVEGCKDTATAAGTIRLPRNQQEGHIPKIALTTGGADPLECLLRKLGIDESEFTLESGSGRVNLFAGSGDLEAGFPVTTAYATGMNDGAAFTPATELWETAESLKRYDMVILSCEGAPHAETKPDSAREALAEYAAAGGRVFMSHWHNYWLQTEIGRFSDAAVWTNYHRSFSEPLTAHIDESFPKGQALSDWLFNVEASTERGQIVINEAKHTLNEATAGLATRWIYYTDPAPPETHDAEGVQYLTFNAPVGAPEEELCGRVVFTDIHVSSDAETGSRFPEGCSQSDELTPQEKALLFMLFDLSACIVPDDEPPPVPVPL